MCIYTCDGPLCFIYVRMLTTCGITYSMIVASFLVYPTHAKVFMKELTCQFAINKTANGDNPKLELKCPHYCPPFYYAVGTDKDDVWCEECSENCLACANTTTCLLCQRGSLYMVNGNYVKCVDKCVDSGAYYTVKQTCTLCPDGCSECMNNKWCTNCYKGFSLHRFRKNEEYHQLCVTDCPLGFFSKDQRCTACAEGCIQCNDYLRCTDCMAPYYFVNVTLLVESTVPRSACVKGCNYQYIMQQLGLYTDNEFYCENTISNLCVCELAPFDDPCKQHYVMVILVTLMSTLMVIFGGYVSVKIWSRLMHSDQEETECADIEVKPAVAPRPPVSLRNSSIPRMREAISEYSLTSNSYIYINLPENDCDRQKSATYQSSRLKSRSNSNVPDIIIHEEALRHSEDHYHDAPIIRKVSTVSESGIFLTVPAKRPADIARHSSKSNITVTEADHDVTTAFQKNDASFVIYDDIGDTYT